MDPSQAPKAVLEIASNLLCKDAPTFNSTINSHFASHAEYQGHGLRVRGASNIKHTSWLFNVLDSGRNPEIKEQDVKWDEATSTAHITATRFLRPSFLPLIALALPVETTLKFLPDSEASGPSSTGAAAGARTLYVTSWKDRWVFERIEERLPARAARLLVAVWAPVATFFVLTISNALFTAYAHLSSTSRHVVEPQATKHLPKPVADNMTSGFEHGKQFGSAIVGAAQWLAYPGVRLLEWSIQSGSCVANAVLPVTLPTPYIYEQTYDRQHKPKRLSIERDEPVPRTAEKELALHELHAQRTAFEQEKNPRHVHEAPAPKEGHKGSDAATDDGTNEPTAPDARVEVGASLDGEFAGKTVSIPERLTSDEPDEPAERLNAGAADVKTLIDEVEMPDATAAAAESPVPAEAITNGEHEDEHHDEQHEAAGATTTTTTGAPSTSGSTKKKNKKKGGKKKAAK